MSPEPASSFMVPDIVVSHFYLKEGDVIADFGVGRGYFLKILSARVGASGKVYACDIQKSLIEKISTESQKLSLQNIHPLWCDLEEPNGLKISDHELDVGILINTLYQIEHRENSVKEMGRTIRSGGRLVLIDWTDAETGMGPTADRVIGAKAATVLCEANGFVLEQDFPAGAHHYGLSFRKI